MPLNTSPMASPSAPNVWTAQQTIDVGSGNKFLKFAAPSADKMMAAFYRYNNTGGAQWATGAMVNSQGAWLTNAWITISGTMAGSPDAEGLYLPQPASADPSMLSVWSDVAGPSVEIRPSSNGAAYHLSCLSPDGTKYLLAIENDGTLHWGNGARAALDTNLYRSAAGTLKTDNSLIVGGTLTIGGTKVLTAAATGTVGLLGTAQTWTASQTIAKGTYWIWGSVSQEIGVEADGSALIAGGARDNVMAFRTYCGASNGAFVFRDTNASVNLLVVGADIGMTQTMKDAATTTATTAHTRNHDSSGTPAAGFGLTELKQLKSSTTAAQSAADWSTSWATATHASRKARIVGTVYDTAGREWIRGEADGANAMIGFLGAVASARTSVTGSRGGNAALAALLTELATKGLITDGTSA